MGFFGCNANHHSLAIADGEATKLNHVAFEVRSIDDMIRGSGRVIRVIKDGLHLLDCAARQGARCFLRGGEPASRARVVWRDIVIPPDLILIPGVIDTNSTCIEHPQVVADRAKDFASVVGPERVLASTDCGFGTFIYLAVPEQIAYAKLRTLAEGAALASRDIF